MENVTEFYQEVIPDHLFHFVEDGMQVYLDPTYDTVLNLVDEMPFSIEDVMTFNGSLGQGYILFPTAEQGYIWEIQGMFDAYLRQGIYMTENERERTLAGATALIEERESDRSRRPPPTEEDLNRLQAQIDTAQHYESLVSTVSDPSNLLSEALLLEGEEFDEQIAIDARREWMISSLRSCLRSVSGGFETC